MKKIKLEIVGLSYSQTQSGAYALVLGEDKGKRRLPIVIGAFEAQAIAIELENMTPQRPLTHDLFKSFATAFSIEVEEIIIFNLLEGVFYAKLVCSDGEKRMEVDARTSDAIAIAVRFGCPIYTYEFILSSAGVAIDQDTPIEDVIEEKIEKKAKATALSDSELSGAATEDLKEMLKKAIDEEAYERATKIRDELAKRKNN
ncbi:MAG: bifunctional nuclease domain-containing protein [Bacteroidota bacterium]